MYNEWRFLIPPTLPGPLPPPKGKPADWEESEFDQKRKRQPEIFSQFPKVSIQFWVIYQELHRETPRRVLGCQQPITWLIALDRSGR